MSTTRRQQTLTVQPVLPRRLFLQQHAAAVGVDMVTLRKASGRNPTTFHRWLWGEKRSDPLNRWVGKQLGLTPELMRRLR